MVKGKKGLLWAGALILAGLLCLSVLSGEPDPREYETFAFVRPNSADILLIREWHDFKDTGAAFYLRREGEELALGSVTTDEYLPFREKEYTVDWEGERVVIRYQYGRLQEWKVAELELP